MSSPARDSLFPVEEITHMHFPALTVWTGVY
jgi:hypothetical protein